jgi:hypothetical protein
MDFVPVDNRGSFRGFSSALSFFSWANLSWFFTLRPI